MITLIFLLLIRNWSPTLQLHKNNRQFCVEEANVVKWRNVNDGLMKNSLQQNNTNYPNTTQESCNQNEGLLFVLRRGSFWSLTNKINNRSKIKIDRRRSLSAVRESSACLRSTRMQAEPQWACFSSHPFHCWASCDQRLPAQRNIKARWQEGVEGT